jgi:site-specific recombinase
MGALKVRVNFCLAFRLALRARSVNPGDRIRGAAHARWRSRPVRFFLPA